MFRFGSRIGHRFYLSWLLKIGDLDLDLDNNCQTHGGYGGNGVCARAYRDNVADSCLLKDGTMPTRWWWSLVLNFHSVTVLTAKDFWNWVEAQQSILSLCLVVGPLTGLSHRTKSSWFISTLTDFTECSGKVSDSSLVITDLDHQAVLPRCSTVRTSCRFRNEEGIFVLPSCSNWLKGQYQLSAQKPT